MKTKSLILPLVVMFSLVGCKNNRKAVDMYKIEEGGTSVDLTDAQQVTRISNFAKVAASKAADVDGIGAHLNIEKGVVHYDQTDEEDYYIDDVRQYTETEHNSFDISASGKINAVVNGLKTAKSFNELGAYVGISDADVSFALVDKESTKGYVESVKDKEEINSLSCAGENIYASAYLKDSKLYADLSSKGLDDFASGVLLGMMGPVETEGETVFSYFVKNVIGLESTKTYLPVNGDDIPLVYPLISKDIIDQASAIDLTPYIPLITANAGAFKDVLTVKVYDDGSFGIQVNVTLEKANALAAYFAASEFFEEFTSFDINLAVMFNGDGSLNRLGLEADIDFVEPRHEYGDTEGVRQYENENLNIDLKGYLTFNYNETIAYPDFSGYVETDLVFPDDVL